VHGAFVTRPSNVAVSTNDASVFNCTTNDTSSNLVLISWDYIAAGSTGLTLIAPVCNVNDAYKSVYHTERAIGVCNLNVTSTQLTNAGTYVCSDLADQALCLCGSGAAIVEECYHHPGS